MFKEYTTKPQVRAACVIETDGKLEQENTKLWAYHHNAGSVYFMAYSEPKVGDYIVRNSEHDIYHVDQATFLNSYTEVSHD